MVERSFDELVLNLRKRRQMGVPPPVVLLGAGASVDAGIGAMSELYEFLGCADFEELVAYVEPLTEAERYLYLSDFLQTQKPTEVTPGYRALAVLCANAYFDLVLSTNLDPLLDDALAAARLRRKDFFLLVNGVTRPDRLQSLLRAHSPRVKVLKLHGDLFLRSMAWTPAEMDSYLAEAAAAVEPAVAGRDVLVVGHSLRDERVRRLVTSAGGAIWYTHPDSVPGHLAGNRLVRAVVGAKARFETLFVELARALDLGEPEPALAFEATTYRSVAPSPPRASLGVDEPGAAREERTVDDLMASVVGLARGGGEPGGTAFLVADPRVIVTDPWSAHGDDPRWSVVTSGGRRFETRVLRRDSSHPFGPVVLDAPAGLTAPGLWLETAPLDAGQTVHVAVAAGERVGMSSGALERTGEQRLHVAPVGEVDRLMQLDFATAPGASGAPVTDADFAVRGYVVAGRADGEPPSYMYPTRHWARALG